MSEGLVTRIGKWIDTKWEDKVTESQLRTVVEELKSEDALIGKALADTIKQMSALDDASQTKEIADLKTRMEKMELYAGMTRKVDPTKPPIAKSAFQM